MTSSPCAADVTGSRGSWEGSIEMVKLMQRYGPSVPDPHLPTTSRTRTPTNNPNYHIRSIGRRTTFPSRLSATSRLKSRSQLSYCKQTGLFHKVFLELDQGPQDESGARQGVIQGISKMEESKVCGGKVKKPGKRGQPAKIDLKAKLERSRQSARECRAKKQRYQYLEELVSSRERAICALREELDMYKQWCKAMDQGKIPSEIRALLTGEELNKSPNPGKQQRSIKSEPRRNEREPLAILLKTSLHRWLRGRTGVWQLRFPTLFPGPEPTTPRPRS
ncbi:LOW QUALITY PROTEIN: cAMP-responsive element-binding protein-like 2 [Anomaloglossus baeobatrachus]